MAYLIFSPGNSASTTTPLKKNLYTFGNSEECDFQDDSCDEPMAAQILKRADTFMLQSLGGEVVKVNGKRCDMKTLAFGDTISLGSLEVKFVENVELNAGKKPSAGADSGQLAEVLQWAEKLVGVSDPKEVLHGLLPVACSLTGADRGRLFLQEEDEELKIEHPSTLENISESAISLALEKGEAIQWHQAAEESAVDLHSSKSILENEISSILVSPFSAEGGAGATADGDFSGYLYLQRQSSSESFSPADKDVFNAFTRFCTSLISSVRTKEELQEKVESLEGIQREGGMVYQCDAMQEVIRLARRAAPVAVPVLINGPTGSGKEELAKYVHSISGNSEKKFLAVNCGAIPENLIESVLFGHKKGSFTGAAEDRKGVFEECDGGTLFLDEVGELPLPLQVKLLRVLQEKTVTPLGSVEEIPVSFRLISATHVDLEQAVSQNKFREDLLFRLNVMHFTLPGLSVRGRDVLLLAEHFLKRFSVEYNRRGLKFSAAAEKALLSHGWPGNIRELSNRIQKAFIFAEDNVIRPEHMELSPETGLKERKSLKEARESAERECVEQSLRDAEGNLTLAASMLGVDRKVLRDIMARLEIEKSEFKKGS